MIDQVIRYASLGWHVFPVYGFHDGACDCGDADCDNAGKHPITRNGLSDATTSVDQIRAWWRAYPRASVGVVMAPSGLCALDVDLYHGDLQKIEALSKLHGELPQTVVGISGSGEGYHFIFKAPGFPVRGILGGVVVRSNAYIIVAPSTHKSGKKYAWEDGLAPGEVEVADFPEAWKDALRKTASVGVVGVPDEESEPEWLRAIPQEQRIADMRAHLEAEKGEIKGESVAGMTFNVARTSVRRYAVRDPEAVLHAMQEIYDPKCSPPWEDRLGRHVWNAYQRANSPRWGIHYEPSDAQLAELGFVEGGATVRTSSTKTVVSNDELITTLETARNKLKNSNNPEKRRAGKLFARMLKGLPLTEHPDDNAVDALKATIKALAQWAPVGSPAIAIAAVLARSVPQIEASQLVALIDKFRALTPARDAILIGDLPEPASDDELRGQLIASKEEGSIKSCGPNIERILKYSGELKGKLRFNELTKDIEVTGGRFDETPKGVLDVAILNWMGAHWQLHTSVQQVGEQLGLVARVCGSYNPVAEYLKSLKWDGTRRLDRWLIDYCGAEDSSYNRKVGSMWMISACARGITPGCKVDTVLVLEGAQGLKKSTAFKILGGDWFSGTPLDLGNKDSYQITTSTWIIELAELSSLRAGEIEAHKAFLSAESDKFRPPYGRVPDTFLRHCVFGGTTNEREYLLDGTGNRRFWACAITLIDATKLREDRDQLWAEAVFRYYSAELNPDMSHAECPGERWWMEPPEWDEAAAVIAKRRAADPWVSIIREWATRVNRPGAGTTAARPMFSIAEVAKQALDINIVDMRRYVKQISAALREAGFETVELPDGERMWARKGTVIHDSQSVVADDTDSPGPKDAN
jgi:predicted P-loop ATPase